MPADANAFIAGGDVPDADPRRGRRQAPRIAMDRM